MSEQDVARLCRVLGLDPSNPADLAYTRSYARRGAEVQAEEEEADADRR